METGLILTAILTLLIMAWFAKVPRYFLSSFLLLSLPVAASVERLSRKHSPLKWTVTGVLLLLTANNLILQIDLQERYSRAFAFVKNRVSGRFRNQNVKYLYLLPYYRAAEFINRRLEATDRILFLGEERTFYVQRPVLASSFNDLNPLFPVLKKSPDATAFRAELRNLGITHILFDPDGLERLARMSPSLYRLEEMEKERLNDFYPVFPLCTETIVTPFSGSIPLLRRIGDRSGSHPPPDDHIEGHPLQRQGQMTFQPPVEADGQAAQGCKKPLRAQDDLGNRSGKKTEIARIDHPDPRAPEEFLKFRFGKKMLFGGIGAIQFLPETAQRLKKQIAIQRFADDDPRRGSGDRAPRPP